MKRAWIKTFVATALLLAPGLAPVVTATEIETPEDRIIAMASGGDVDGARRAMHELYESRLAGADDGELGRRAEALSLAARGLAAWQSLESAMIAEGAIAFSDDGLPIADAKVMQNALEYSSMFDIPIINHAEDECLKADGVMHMGKVSTNLGLPSSPGITESSMVHRDLELAVHVGARLHVPHVSSARSVEHIKTLKKKSEKISAEVTAHHLYFTDDDLMSYNTNLKVAPPIRSKKDKKALIAAVKNGTIDCIATDHAPHTIEEKEGTFDIAPFGMIGLETCFALQ